jgi:hypothetical protein
MLLPDLEAVGVVLAAREHVFRAVVAEQDAALRVAGDADARLVS